MGTVYERKYESGRVVFRMKMGNKKTGDFTMTFNEFDDALQFLEENESKFLLDPQSYFDWREKEFKSMRRSRERAKRGLIRGPVKP